MIDYKISKLNKTNFKNKSLRNFNNKIKNKKLKVKRAKFINIAKHEAEKELNKVFKPDEYDYE